MNNIQNKSIVYLVKWAATCLIGLFLTGCSDDFLESSSLNDISSSNFYETKEEMRLATATLYTQTWFLFNDKAYYLIGDGRAGNLNIFYGDEVTQYPTLRNTALDVKVRETWESFYTVIAQSNTTINAINHKKNAHLSETDKNAALGEARFMRATAYFYLVRLWGPVIIIEDNIKVAKNPILPLNTVEDVYRFIMEDLEFAADWLPEKDTPGRVTRWTAKAMLAKVYLTRSGYNNGGVRDQKYLDKAKLTAEEVCKNAPNTLMDNYADLFLATNNNNSESLFALQWIAGPWGQGNTAQAYLCHDMTLSGVGDGWNMCWPSYDMLYVYDKKDTIRRNATFMTDGVFYPELNKNKGGLRFESSKQEDGSPDPNGIPAACKKHVIGSAADAGVPVLFMSTSSNTYMLRLADTYLTYAEAILGNNGSTADPEALHYFNRVRQRNNNSNGMDPQNSITLDDIYYERRIEFALEGQYWFDLIARYYFQPAEVLRYIQGQHRNAKYTYTRLPNNLGDAKHTSDYDIAVNAIDDAMHLPYPEVDVIANPLMNQPPVPYYK